MSKAALFLSLGALLAGCGPTPEPLPPPPLVAPLDDAPDDTPDAPEPAPTATLDPAPPAPPQPQGLTLLWASKTGKWNHVVEIQPATHPGDPFGDIVSVGGHRVHLHRRDTGEIIRQAPICYMHNHNGFGFVNATTAIVICQDEIRELTLPGLGSRTVMQTQDVEDGAFAAGRVAIGDEAGVVRVLDAKTWTEIDRFDVGADVESVALSPDGRRVAVGTGKGLLMWRDVAAKKSHDLHRKANGSLVQGLSFSRDGNALFGNDKSFESTVYAIPSGRALRSFESGSWESDSVFFADGTVASAGSDGFRILGADGRPRVLIDETAEGIAATADGRLVCSGDRDGTVSCFADGKVPPSRTPAAAPAPVTKPAPAPSSPPAAAGLEGKILRRTGDRVVVELTSPPSPQAKGTLSRRFGRNFGGLTVTGWLVVADVVVHAVHGSKVELRITAHKSKMTVNGSNVDHFTPGMEIKLEVTP